MKAPIFILVAFTGLSGCAITGWGRPDTTRAQLEADRADCIAIAAKEHPPKVVQTIHVPTYTYGAVSYALAPEVLEVDTNRDRRNRARDACIESRGYTFGLGPIIN